MLMCQNCPIATKETFEGKKVYKCPFDDLYTDDSSECRHPEKEVKHEQPNH
jgi:hypothetical protein